MKKLLIAFLIGSGFLANAQKLHYGNYEFDSLYSKTPYSAAALRPTLVAVAVDSVTGKYYHTALSGGGSQWTTSGSTISYTAGFVGIGTASPSDMLEVRKDQVTTGTSTVTSALLTNANASGIAAFAFTDGTNRAGGIQYNNSTGSKNLFSCSYTDIPYYFGTNNTIRLTIQTNATYAGAVGIGTTTPNSTLQIAGSFATPMASKTAAYTATVSDNTITGNATTAAFSVTLPTAVGITGRTYTIKKTDASANAVTVATTSSQTIDGATTYALSAQYGTITVKSDGSNWLIVSKF